jgi:hypothetical protein
MKTNKVMFYVAFDDKKNVWYDENNMVAVDTEVKTTALVERAGDKLKVVETFYNGKTCGEIDGMYLKSVGQGTYVTE